MAAGGLHVQFPVEGSMFRALILQVCFADPMACHFFSQMWEAAIVATEWDCSTRLEFSLSARDWGLEPATSLFCLSTLTALVFEEHRFLGSIGVEINGVTVCLPSPPPLPQLSGNVVSILSCSLPGPFLPLHYLCVR